MANNASRYPKNHKDILASRCSRLPALGSGRFSRFTLAAIGDQPVNIRPLLMLQRRFLKAEPVVFSGRTFLCAQRYYLECVQNRVTGSIKPLIVHEMMPAHQQDFVIDCLNSVTDYSLRTAPVVFTSQAFREELERRVPWIAACDNVIYASTPRGDELPLATPGPGIASEPSVSCICLRAGSGGKWVVMDHDTATIIRPDVAPDPEIVPRLMKHTVEISGHRLAPYLAMMFDVPDCWKMYPELATRSLLVFNEEACALGCIQEGVPSRIIWCETLGIVF